REWSVHQPFACFGIPEPSRLFVSELCHERVLLCRTVIGEIEYIFCVGFIMQLAYMNGRLAYAYVRGERIALLYIFKPAYHILAGHINNACGFRVLLKYAFAYVFYLLAF